MMLHLYGEFVNKHLFFLPVKQIQRNISDTC